MDMKGEPMSLPAVNNALVFDSIIKLLANKPISIDDKTILLLCLQNKSGRDSLITAISELKGPMLIEGNENFKDISDIINNMLNSIQENKDYNYKTLYRLLEFSRRVYNKV
jgi:hypothetical protein